jgi:hypothetical protein
MLAELERRTLEDLGEEATVLDYVEEWQASGRTLYELVSELSKATGYEHRRDALVKYLSTRFGDAATARLSRARARGAHALAETAKSQVDELQDVTREEIQLAKLKTDTAFWIAERWNREELGGARGPSVTVTVEHLHLDALRAPVPQIQAAIVPAIAEGGDPIDYEVTTS